LTFGDRFGATELVSVVSSHHERAVVRIGSLFLKVETDPERATAELAALRSAPVPVPVPSIVWSTAGPPAVLALSGVPGTPLARLGHLSGATAAAWAAAGAVTALVHASPVPVGVRSWFAFEGLPSWIEEMRTWLLTNTDIDRDVINRRSARAHDVLDQRRVEPVFMHGDLQAEHVFVDGDLVTGVIDWADAAAGDPLYDLAVLTVGHGEHLDAVIDGYGTDVDRTVIGAYWDLRKLGSVRWMIEHGYDASDDIAALS
jgi:aminoglycoside phosphotransferase (APT) family kinase protein